MKNQWIDNVEKMTGRVVWDHKNLLSNPRGTSSEKLKQDRLCNWIKERSCVLGPVKAAEQRRLLIRALHLCPKRDSLSSFHFNAALPV